MAIETINGNSVQPLGLPDTGTGTEMGDTWNQAVDKLNAMFAELYARTGGTGTLTRGDNFKNLIVGGDFTTNPWQRGTSFTGIAATLTYTADRFFVVGGHTSVSAKAAKAAFSSNTGMTQAFRFGRTADASSLSAITAGQILETNNSINLKGQNVVLSFWAAKEANFSAQSGNVTVSVVYGTGTDQSAASAVAGTWTGQANVYSGVQALSSTMTRYSFSGTVPTSATQVGVLMSYTPVGSAGAADSVLIQGVQLEVGTSATAFEHRPMQVELALAQRYFYRINEPGGSGIAVGMGVSTASNLFAVNIPLPVTMRTAPTVTVTNGSFGFQLANAYLAGTGLAALAAGQTVNSITLTQNATVASNNAATFVGGSGVGAISAAAEY